MAKRANPPSPLEGRWRITSMEMWGQDFVDAEVEGYFEFGPDGLGSFQFGYVSGNIDFQVSTRDGKAGVEWSWKGHDEMDSVSGRGWATIDGDKINGVIAIHKRDKSAFEAIRKDQPCWKSKKLRR